MSFYGKLFSALSLLCASSVLISCEKKTAQAPSAATLHSVFTIYNNGHQYALQVTPGALVQAGPQKGAMRFGGGQENYANTFSFGFSITAHITGAGTYPLANSTEGAYANYTMQYPNAGQSITATDSVDSGTLIVSSYRDSTSASGGPIYIISGTVNFPIGHIFYFDPVDTAYVTNGVFTNIYCQ